MLRKPSYFVIYNLTPQTFEITNSPGSLKKYKLTPNSKEFQLALEFDGNHRVPSLI